MSCTRAPVLSMGQEHDTASTQATAPVSIGIALSEIYSLHRLLETYVHSIVEEPANQLHELLRLLGPSPDAPHALADFQLRLELTNRWSKQDAGTHGRTSMGARCVPLSRRQ